MVMIAQLVGRLLPIMDAAVHLDDDLTKRIIVIANVANRRHALGQEPKEDKKPKPFLARSLMFA